MLVYAVQVIAQHNRIKTRIQHEHIKIVSTMLVYAVQVIAQVSNALKYLTQSFTGG
ncbi:hypothetical protein HanXRQr2_Chr16g0768861 [Helianthus annuus]|uniref:Uncharacterized protein n=1 Tax=Helianthus annuus TaxID=4232 RepID=A0A251S3R1_HELAN|nr:hypothetical protein HanXRQr2_Chr16g0768861 [Helianthus annuus]KAJ0822850.1 hypothetical protein HanPSC8_Chr16g0736881 [Helianthus annuus]